MSRLQAEFQRLFATEGADATGPSTPRRVRGLALGVVNPAAWEPLAALWQGVQQEFGLPPAAIVVSGGEAMQLWFSLAVPVPAAQGLAFLDGLRRRYLPELPARRVTMATELPVVPALQPVAASGEERWSAFVAPDLAPIFAETPWLDMPPGDDGQAQLLSQVKPISPGAFDEVMRALAEAGPPESSAPPSAPAPAAAFSSALAATDDPRRFLLSVMNDANVPLALRIEAARALL